jgi:hypothetical protein
MMAVQMFETTVLDGACDNDHASIDIIKKLIHVGGKELLTTINIYGKCPLFFLFSALQCATYRHGNDNAIAKISFLISKVIQFQVAGEFGIGGLSDTAFDDETQDIVYEEWNAIIMPALEQIDITFINKQPILHAVIIAKAPSHIIRDVTSRFDCITCKDSMGRYPIDIAIAKGLKWDEAMKDLVRRFTASTVEQLGQIRLMINVAELHGIQ